jgi:hypothetical protein
MGVVSKSEDYEVPNYEEEIALFGVPLGQLQRNAEFEDWARNNGIKIPEFPG